MNKPLILPHLLDDPATWAGRDWEPFHEGVEISWIRRPDHPDGPRSALLRYAPGTGVPRHSHAAFEYILILDGAQSDANGRHEAGTLVVNPPGTSHTVHSDVGCVVLAVWEAPVRFE